MRIDSTYEHYSFDTPIITFLPSDYGTDIDSLGFSTKPLYEEGINNIPVNTTQSICFDLYGRPTTTANGIQIEVSKNGLIRKRIKINK